MSLKTIIKESANKNALGFEAALKEELNSRIKLAIEAKMRNDEEGEEESDDAVNEATGSIKDGYYVTNMSSNKITHDKPFADSKPAISHADKQEDKTGSAHRVTKVKGGKIDKQWEFSVRKSPGKWELFTDYKGEDAHEHLRNVPKSCVNGND